MESTLRAKYIAPCRGPVIEDGAVAFADGIIRSVGRRRDVDSANVLDLGDVLMLPGLINAHTHLELSAFARPPEGARDFAGWLTDVMANEPFPQAVIAGAEESLRAGVTAAGDITRQPQATRPLLKHGPLRVVSFGEVTAIGARRGLLSGRLAAATSESDASDRLIVGVSPHAPYSIEPEGIVQCVRWAAQHERRLCMHLAETKEEAEFLMHGTGRFVDLLQHVGAYDERIPIPHTTPIRFARDIGLLTPRTILAHVNYPESNELEWLAGAGTHVAYCPRTHAYFGHEPHPFERMLAYGINVCLGTDSKMSSPDLSILSEMRWLYRNRPHLDPQTILDMGTIHGAAALGLHNFAGTLQPGRWADIVAVPFSHPGTTRPLEDVLSSDIPPSRVFIAGETVTA